MTEKSLIPVVIDTRESTEATRWSFDVARITTEMRKLDTGDYSLNGFENVVTIERKSLDDFVKSVIWEWQRFRCVCRRMAAMDVACVAVEASIADVLAHKYYSETNPHSVLGKALAIQLQYGFPVNFWGSREQCRWMAEEFLKLAWERLRNPFAIHPCEIPGAV